MTAPAASVGFRRSWPQRIVILFGLALAGASAFAAARIWSLYDSLESIPRFVFPSGVLAEQSQAGGPVNFLLIGTDSAAGLDPDDPVTIGRDLDEAKQLADVIMLLRIDPGTGQASVLSFPRDLWVKVPGASEMKLSEAFRVGGPQNGVRYVTETLTRTFEVPIHHVVVVDFVGFREVVEAIGGVPVHFPYETQAPSTGLTMPAGCHVLDGSQALAYVRPREDYQELIDGAWELTGNNDLQRNKRQQDFLVLALDRVIDRGARDLFVRNDLINAGAQAVTLDQTLSARDLIDLGQAFADFNPENLARYTFTSPVIYDDVVEGKSVLRVHLDQAQSLLDIFRGFEGLRPADVTVDVIDARDAPGGGEGDEVSEEISLAEQLESKSFRVGESFEGGASDDVDTTTIRFTEDRREEAVLLARFLVDVPEFELVSGISDSVTLVAAEDVGFLFAPREAADLEDAMAEVLPSSTTTSTTTTLPEDPEGTSPTEVTTTTSGIMGKPPPGVSCG